MHKKIGVAVLALFFVAFGSAGLAYGATDLHVAHAPRVANADFSTDEILVKFKGMNKPMRLKIPSAGKAEVLKMLAQYQGRADVVYAEPNYIATELSVPNDPYYSPFQWNFGPAVTGGINLEPARDVTHGQGAVVAVIDTGVAYENYTQNSKHKYYLAPDLAGVHFVAGYDFVNNDTHPNDDEGHGTHVTGTIAETTDNNIGVAGIAPDASIMPIKVLNASGNGTYADIADGIRYAADHGANVINLSLGGSTGSQTLLDAIAYAYGKGVTIVAAAGNDGAGSVSYPAAYDQYVIAVGATRYDKTKAYYSNYGPSVDVVAPGGDINVDQNGDGYGDGILQQTFSGKFNNFGYYFYSGTSMATPHVAGTAALLISHGNATTPEQIRQALEDTAVDLGDAGRDDTFGYGLIDAYAALNWVAGPPPPNQPPIADAGTDQIAYTGADINFNGQNSYDPDGTIASYHWDFGDGGTGSGVAPSHAYSAAGTYTVVLTVTDNGGLTASDTMTATVSDAPPQTALHVASITMSGVSRNSGGRCQATGEVEIVDQNNAPVAGVVVGAHWTVAYDSYVSATTDSSGYATFVSRWKNCGTFKLTVNTLTKAGDVYDPSHNVETADSVTIQKQKNTR